ncbi:hypothetical protein BMS3Bbin10_00586 [bacterium BMS3Bbin10]|nr:hypothetical protein BMS3Bbin10_00586 [bacterium BMS3Bbin10]
MSSEWAVVAGTIAGGLVSLGTTFFSNWLAERRRNRLNVLRKKLLTKALVGAGKEGWLRIEMLAQIIGADPESTRAHLIEIEARGSMQTDREVWSLVSRNPLPTT